MVSSSGNWVDICLASILDSDDEFICSQYLNSHYDEINEHETADDAQANSDEMFDFNEIFQELESCELIYT